MNDFLKTLLNIRSLRAALRELSFEQLVEIREKFDFLSIQKASSLSEGSRVIYRNKLIGGHAASQNKEDKDVS